MSHEFDQDPAGAPDLPTTIAIEPADPGPAAPPTEDAQAAPEAPPAPPPESMVIIRPGQEPVLRRVLLAHYNPNCGLCKEGWTTEVVHGVNVPRICFCTVIRYEKEQRELARKNAEVRQAIMEPKVLPAPHPDRIEQAERRIARLTGDVATLETELKARQDEFTASLADLDKATSCVTASGLALNAEIQTTSQQVADDEKALAEAERSLSTLRQQLADRRSALARAQETGAIVEATLKDVQAERQRREDAFKAKTRRLRHDLDKARRRLATARGYTGITQPQATD